MKIRSHLLLFAAGVLVPVLAFALILAALLVRHEQQVFAEGTIARLRATMTAMDAKVEGHVNTLDALGVSASLQERDFRRFQVQMARVLASQPEWLDVFLSGADGRTIASASLPFGDASLPRMLDPGTLDQVVVLEKAVIGGLSRVPAIERKGLTIAIPIKHGGKPAYVLAAVIRPESFIGLIEAQHLGEGWVSGLVDADGRFIARVPPPPSEFASPAFRAAMARSSESWYRGTSVEGRDVYTSHIRSEFTRWSIGLGVPAAAVDAGATHTAWIMAGGVAGAIALALLLALWLGNRVSRPVVAIAEAARGIGRGDPAVSGGWEHVTELRQVGSALQEASAAVREREVLLEREKRVLEESDRSKDEFIAMLSHELRNPLAAVVTATDVLEGEKLSDESDRHAYAVIRRQSRHMSRLLDDLLDISRLTMGKVKIQLEVLNLAEIAVAVAATFRTAGHLSPDRIAVDATPVWIRADRSRIEQILSNLLDNAIKFSPPDARISVKVAAEDGSAVMQVSDKGRGFPQDLLKDAFGLFVQGKQGLARQMGGMGVGLALVKRLAELQDGTVSASSVEGQGSTFVVRFAAVPPPAGGHAASSPASPGHAVSRTPRRVLLIEDGADFRAMLADALTRTGHDVFQAPDGRTGVAMAMEQKPDVALIDIGLPDIDGYHVAKLLRAHCSHPIALIALSGYGQAADRQKALASGFDDHLTKPSTPERIAEAIEEHAPGRQRKAS